MTSDDNSVLRGAKAEIRLLQERNKQLEAKVIELTTLVFDWKDHHDYMAELRANVDTVTDGIELIVNLGAVTSLPELDTEDPVRCPLDVHRGSGITPCIWEKGHSVPCMPERSSSTNNVST